MTFFNSSLSIGAPEKLCTKFFIPGRSSVLNCSLSLRSSLIDPVLLQEET